MPNHVTNRITVTGPREARLAFKRAFLTQIREQGPDGQEILSAEFDFERIVPMPDLIRNTESSSVVQMGLLLLGRIDVSDTFLLPGSTLESEIARYLSYPHVKAAGVSDYAGLKAWIRETAPDCEEKARAAIRAKEEFGHSSWYSWSIANWGTKWNAYSFQLIGEDDDQLDFSFDKAWSPPEPIFAALAKRPECADLSISIRSFDEGWLFAFSGVISKDCYLGETVEPTPEFYEEVYGFACPVDEEGKEEEAA
ncbi:hypothetical protein D2T29_22030 [Sinirhodobacter populi]|uniref:YubB ferredoxin-like domain-containing protein n=1 Tax=Paenirhodobacter populi TaxID=2306993 RepID=A0A443JZF9_9RHOB|nr:hypothetical protein [Sinirhodobacter populi]RWR25494.1 hypothetical protein D2T29_22030 [Sinirhodobacter populi]RWR25897.1 hypothetical protein D2T31_21480 [Sinirhodobacter populi]